MKNLFQGVYNWWKMSMQNDPAYEKRKNFWDFFIFLYRTRDFFADIPDVIKMITEQERSRRWQSGGGNADILKEKNSFFDGTGNFSPIILKKSANKETDIWN